ncbi:MAG: hypothetical protein ACXWX4_11460 [Actinomycetota bacterium]
MATLRDAVGLRDPIAIEGGLGTRAERVVVDALGVDSIAKIVRMWTSAELSRPTLVRVQEATLGNPLFALEIVRALLRHGPGLPGEPLLAPGDLEGLLHARLRRLPARTRNALLLAAATTRPTVHVLRAATPNAQADLLGPAEDADVVRVRGDEVTFTHPLLASTVYRRTSSARRRDAHRRLAEVVNAEERARHFALAAAEPSADVAAAFEDAAHGASSRGAPATAAELAELAHRMTPTDDVEASRRRAMKAAEYRFVSGDAVAALALAEELLEVTPPGPGRAEIGYLISVFSWNDVTRLRPVLGAVVADLEEPSALLASAIADLGWVAILGGDLRAASARAREAIELAEGLDDPGPLSLGLVTAAYAEYMLGRRRWIRSADDASRERRRAGLTPGRRPLLRRRSTSRTRRGGGAGRPRRAPRGACTRSRCRSRPG